MASPQKLDQHLLVMGDVRNAWLKKCLHWNKLTLNRPLNRKEYEGNHPMRETRKQENNHRNNLIACQVHLFTFGTSRENAY